MRSLDGVADDWPISYQDLESYYDMNDRETGVAGLAGDPANPPSLVASNAAATPGCVGRDH